MAAGWFPEATVDPGNDAGSYTDNGEPKGLLHTTEGKTYAGARQAYVVNNSWPHATCSFEGGRFRIWQHTSILVAARSLRNLAGGVQTNRDRVAQLEIVGTANRHNAASWGTQYVENFPRAYLDGIARWMRFCNQTLGIPNRCSVIFKKYPESYGANGVRLSGSSFDAYSGWLGHQHAPENDHGDPGLIDMPYLLSAAAGTPQPPEEDMPLTTDEIAKIATAVWARDVAHFATAHGTAAHLLRLAAAPDIAELADRITEQLMAQFPGGDFDQATVEAGVRAVLGGLDNP